MKKIISLLLCVLLLTACGNSTVAEVTAQTQAPTEPVAVENVVFTAPEYVSRFDAVTEIILSDAGIPLK